MVDFLIYSTEKICLVYNQKMYSDWQIEKQTHYITILHTKWPTLVFYMQKMCLQNWLEVSNVDMK